MSYGIYEYVVSKNLLRRQLTANQRQGVIKNLREKGHSFRAIADMTGIPKSTVQRDADELAKSGQLEQPEKVQGKDGRERPATASPKPKPEAKKRKDITFGLNLRNKKVNVVLQFDAGTGSVHCPECQASVSTTEVAQ